MLADMPATVPDDKELARLAREVGAALKRQGVMLATAESCTGGWVAQMVTAIAGSSEWFDRGFVTYTNLSKRELLEVKTDTLARQGAVSEAVARAMAENALKKSHAQVTVAVTGIAGPSGGTPEKPVGMVWFAWAGSRRDTISRRESFSGDREAVRRQAVATALRGLLEFLAN
jgi:nicotinamide-nucleotide amidase